MNAVYLIHPSAIPHLILLAMSSTTASVKSTNRFLEMTQRFASRLPGSTQKRSRQEAMEHLSANVSAILYMEGRPKYKRRVVEDVEKKDEDTKPVVEKAKDETIPAALEVECVPTVTSTSPMHTRRISDAALAEQEIQRQKEELVAIEKDLVALENTKQQILQEVVDVIGAYQYGLSKISALTDLSTAPDAIMPGNF